MPEAINTETVLLGRPADVIDDAERSRSEIRALLDSRSEAVRIKDIDRLMSLYSPDVVYFDVVPGLQFTGSRALRA
jgi:ketosteroid isomerase-like protein